jgi:MFS family permease
MGFIKTWQSMAALRVILGIFEAGFFPGSVYLLRFALIILIATLNSLYSTWYVRYEVQKRYSVFYIIGSLASACAGILAFGIMHMGGLAGLGGWRWIFILEVSFYGLPSFYLQLKGHTYLSNWHRRLLLHRQLP